MTLTLEQLSAILARTLPGERLRESRAHAGGRYTLSLAGGERASLLTFESPEAAEAAQAALDMLRAEVDLAVPQIRGADAGGAAAGTPCLVTGELAGEPLAEVLPALTDGQLYTLGQRLGEAAYRIHRIRCDRFGALAAGLAADGERDYVLARLAADTATLRSARLMDEAESEAVRAWFESELAPVGNQPALTCGGLRPDAILVRPSGSTWGLAGLAAWGGALGWTPAWDHAGLFEAAADARYFSLRVGYGHAYDEATTRAYEQTREAVLRPYRALLSLRRAVEHGARGERGAARRRKNVVLGLVGVRGEG